MAGLPLRFPFGGMACPEPSCSTAVYTTYSKLVQHWKVTHQPVISLYTCSVCRRTFSRKPDANRHLRDCHSACVVQGYFPNRRYIPPSGPMPERMPGILTIPSQVLYPQGQDVSTQTEKDEAREAARRERQRIAAASSANHLATRELDNIFPDERPFTLESTEDVTLDYED